MTNEERLHLLDQKLNEEKLAQEKALVIDFDAAYDEWKSTEGTFPVQFRGKIYRVPASQPMRYAYLIARHCIQNVDGKRMLIVPEEIASELLELQLGKEFLEDLSKSDVSMDFVYQTIVPQIAKKWGLNVVEGKNA